MKPDLTAVVFRKWRSAPHTILVLFPEIDEGQGLCSSYDHIGQHAGANYLACVARTTPATPAEYADLKAELESIGYNLRVIKRRVRN